MAKIGRPTSRKTVKTWTLTRGNRTAIVVLLDETDATTTTDIICAQDGVLSMGRATWEVQHGSCDKAPCSMLAPTV